MTTDQLTAGITDDNPYETVRHPGDKIRLRVTEGGKVLTPSNREAL
jgi:hypothetical protein